MSSTIPISDSESQSFDPDFQVYLCFGQSNMEGAGTIEEQDKEVNERFLCLQPADCPDKGWSLGTWRPAVPPLFHCYTGLSLANSFGQTMLENLPESAKIGVVPVAIGGCDIRLFDKDLYQDYLHQFDEDWFVSKIVAYNHNPYKRLIELARLAQKRGRIRGILLHQGETNNEDRQWPQYVKKVYQDILKDLGLDAADVPLLAGQVVRGNEEHPGICAAMNPIIDSLPETIPTAHVISSEGCSFQEDNVHFDSEGNRELGRRYARKMLELL